VGLQFEKLSKVRIKFTGAPDNYNGRLRCKNEGTKEKIKTSQPYELSRERHDEQSQRTNRKAIRFLCIKGVQKRHSASELALIVLDRTLCNRESKAYSSQPMKS
jgi:hypothetical protein